MVHLKVHYQKKLLIRLRIVQYRPNLHIVPKVYSTPEKITNTEPIIS